MKTSQQEITQDQALDQVELITIDGGVVGDGNGGGCIPDPLDKLRPQTPIFPTGQVY